MSGGISNFLKKSVHRSEVETKINASIYFGNEAADADSIVTSLCYAYFSSNQYHIKDWHIPVVSIKRKELHLRRDVEILLNKVDVQLSDLVCLDEVECKLDQITNLSNVKVILTDHNAMPAKVASVLSPKLNTLNVYEILDHHVDLKQHPECSGSARNIAFNSELKVAEVGSACTLIFEKYFPIETPQSESSGSIESDVATLLMGVIALDTMNMSPQAAKGTPRDGRALQTLQKFSPLDCTALYEELSGAKMSISFWDSLSAEDCLLLDYKVFYGNNKHSENNMVYNIGISSVLLPAVRFLTTKSDIINACGQYLFGNNSSGGNNNNNSNSDADSAGKELCDVLVTMHLVTDPAVSRELIVFAKSPERLQDIISFLTSPDTATDLKLSPIELSEEATRVAEAFNAGGMYIALFSQGNLKASRKQVAPILTAYYEQTALN